MPVFLRKTFLLSTAFIAAAAIVTPVQSDDSVAQETNGGAANAWGNGVETVVVTGARFNPNNAPAKASLDTTEPQTIINKNYIQDSITPTADYVTILGIAPSLTGMSINGPGLSDGSVKNTLRGQPDGNFNMTFDGIPFGDTNGPTHHSESYFPSSTIGGIDVDRGPGNAGNLGAASYGGTISIFSEGLTDDFHGRQTFTYGSWNTYNINTNVQSGAQELIPGLGNTRALANFQYTGSEGYLTLQNTIHDNELIKIEQDLGPDWSVTFLANRNELIQHLSDNNGATAAQVAVFGKKYALEEMRKDIPDYFQFNGQHKQTDIDYLKVAGTAAGFIIDDQAYTYAYVNKTTTANNIIQVLEDVQDQLEPGALPKDINPASGAVGTKVGGVSHPQDVEAYTKQNAYRVWGNIFRASRHVDFDDVSLEFRAGFWAEGQATQRERVYYDATLCQAVNCIPFKGGAIQFADTNNKSANGNKPPVLAGVPLGVGYFEHTGWTQYEPFLEVEIKPLEDLTITPGIKYVWWKHDITPNSVVKGKPPVFYHTESNQDSFTTQRMLYFATANYKIEPNWSAYFQYATGIYVPDISAFEFSKPIFSFPKAQTTTNYQFGSVYYADNLTADADIYYIDSANTIQFITGNGANGCTSGDSCALNAGYVVYKGIEGEATYTFDDQQFDGLLSGLAVFANGSLNSAKGHTNPTNLKNPGPALQLQQAPYWTAAGGLIYKSGGWKLSLIDKVVGQQYEDSPGSRAFVNGQAFYRLPAYNLLDFTGYYDVSQYYGIDWEIGGGVYNILNARNVLSMNINDGAPVGSAAENVNDPARIANSTDQYFFMPQRSYQITIKAHF